MHRAEFCENITRRRGWLKWWTHGLGLCQRDPLANAVPLALRARRNDLCNAPLLLDQEKRSAD
jgi:hypothetical protein